MTTMTEKKPRKSRSKKNVDTPVVAAPVVDLDKEPWKADTPEAVLCRIADAHTVTVKYAAKNAAMLATQNMKIEDVTPSLVSKAEHLEHKWNEAFKERVVKFNRNVAILNGEDPDAVVTPGTTNTTTKNSAKPPKEPKPAAAKVDRDDFGSSVNSISHTINKAITTTYQTPDSLAKASGVPLARVKAHIKWLEQRNLVDVGDGLTVRRKDGPVNRTTPAQRKTEVEMQLFGYPITAIFRYAGSNGLDFEKTCLAVETLSEKSIKDREGLMKTHYTAGKSGKDKWGAIPELTEEQTEQLEAAME